MAMRTSSRVSALLVLGVGAALAWTLTGPHQTRAAHASVSRTEAVAPSLPEPARGGAAPSRPVPRDAPVADDAAQERVIDELELGDDEKLLAAELGSSREARNLARLVFAGNHHAETGDTDAAQRRWVRELQESPRATMASIRAVLQREALARENMASARASLLLLAASLPGERTEAASLARRDMIERVAPSRGEPTPEMNEVERAPYFATNPTMAMPITAHSVFLATTEDSRSALEGTVEAIVAQPDHAVQNAMAYALLEHAPELGGPLREALAAQQVSVTAFAPGASTTQ